MDASTATGAHRPDENLRERIPAQVHVRKSRRGSDVELTGC